jgi:hypothetical protein
MKILLGNFNAKVGREDIFKPIIGNESLHEASNDNEVREVNFACYHSVHNFFFVFSSHIKKPKD